MLRKGHSGYPLKWFTDQDVVQNLFQCVTCFQVLKHPVRATRCGHQFCACCVEKILRNESRCPSCRKGISKSTILKDYPTRRVIKKLTTKCCNEGCSWVGKLLSLLKVHMKNCNFSISELNGDTVQQLSVVKYDELRKSPSVTGSTFKKTPYEGINKLKGKKAFPETCTKLSPTYQQTLRQLKLDPSVNVVLRITNYIIKLRLAKLSKRRKRIDSKPFYTSSGYKIKVSVYLNQGSRRARGYKGYIGVYIFLMQGDHDDWLKWPFNERVTFIVVDQQSKESEVHNFEVTMIPEGQKELNRPLTGSNSGLGNPKFIRHSTLRTRKYVRNHCLYIAVAVGP